MLRAFGTPAAFAPLWWLGAYAVFVGLNIAGVETSLRFTVAITLLALAILLVFWAAALPRFELAQALDAAPGAGASRWLPRGWSGVLGALPFAIWFYLGIEQLPLAAEEAHAPERDLPRGILLGLATLVLCSFLTLVSSVGIAPGAAALARSEQPLYDGLESLLGAGLGSRALALLAVAGLVASFHAIIFAYGRQIYSLSRAGYFPRWLSLTHATRRTPVVALLAGAALGYAVALAIFLLGPKHPVGAVLLNMAVFGAVLSYGLQMAAFIRLRRLLPAIARPYRSPLGVPGAALAFALSALTLYALFTADPMYRGVVLGALIWYAFGLLWFALAGRGQLVLSPEERFALAARGEADPGELH